MIFLQLTTLLLVGFLSWKDSVPNTAKIPAYPRENLISYGALVPATPLSPLARLTNKAYDDLTGLYHCLRGLWDSLRHISMHDVYAAITHLITGHSRLTTPEYEAAVDGIGSVLSKRSGIGAQIGAVVYPLMVYKQVAAQAGVSLFDLSSLHMVTADNLLTPKWFMLDSGSEATVLESEKPRMTTEIEVYVARENSFYYKMIWDLAYITVFTLLAALAWFIRYHSFYWFVYIHLPRRRIQVREKAAREEKQRKDAFIQAYCTPMKIVDIEIAEAEMSVEEENAELLMKLERCQMEKARMEEEIAGWGEFHAQSSFKMLVCSDKLTGQNDGIRRFICSLQNEGVSEALKDFYC